jgi:MSHA pilin protein MshC
MMRARVDAKGFTLVEMTVVLVVIGILAAVAIPRLVSGDAFSSRSFFDESKSIVRYAQKVAVAQRRLIFVNVAATRVEACYDAGCASRVPSPVDPADPLGAHTDSTEARWKLDPGRITMSAVNFTFNGLGQPSAGAVITFTSNVPDDPARAITVANQTGYVY